MKKIIIFFSCFFIFKTILLSKSLEFWNNTRFRYEYQKNFNLKSYGSHPVIGNKNDGFLIGRIRTGINIKWNKHIYTSLGIQHAFAWNLALSNDNFYNKKFDIKNNPYKDYFEPFNTYLLIKFMDISLKIGRQQIYYGNRRIFGPGNWGNSGRWLWDAIKLSYKFDKEGFIDFYYGRTMLHEYQKFSLKHRHGFNSFGFYSSFPIVKTLFTLKLEPFAMTKRDYHSRYFSHDKKKGDFKSYYYGMRGVLSDFYNFKIDATYIKQDGDYSKDDISAYGYHILVGYKFEKAFISGEYSFASGDDNKKDDKYKTFDGAFGARDKMYGRMNLFHWKNIKDGQLNLELFPFKNFYSKLEFHKFWLAEKKDAWYLNKKFYIDPTGKSGSYVGKEFDIVLKYKIKSNIFQVGFGYFWPGRFAKNVASSAQADWFFLQYELKFKKCKIF